MRFEEYEAEYEKGAIPFWPNHALKEVIAALVMVCLLVTLTLLFPAPMEPRADPFVTPEHIKPEWYFLAAYQFLKLSEHLAFIGAWAPKVIGILVQGAGALVLLLLPFIDNSPIRRPVERPLATTAGVLCAAGFVLLTVWGYLS